MITTEIFEIQKSENLTKNDVEIFFEQKNIKPVKWAIVKILDNSTKILASFIKKN